MQGITNEWQLWWFEAVKVDRMILLSGGISGYLIPPHPAHYKGIQLDILWWRSVVSECTSVGGLTRNPRNARVSPASDSESCSVRRWQPQRMLHTPPSKLTKVLLKYHPQNWHKWWNWQYVLKWRGDEIYILEFFLSIKLSIIRMQIFYSLKKTQLKS